MKKLLIFLFFPLSFWGQLSTAVANTPAAVQVPKSFLGLAIEWGNANNVIGQSSTGTNVVFQQLTKNLTNGGNSLNIRVGGNSTDATTTPRSVIEFAQLYQTSGVNVNFWLGVNMKTATISQAQAQANAYVSGMPTGSLNGLELGNEPDLYGITPSTYYTRLAQWETGIRSATGNLFLLYMDPSCADPYACTTFSFPGILVTNSGYFGASSLHCYVASTLSSGQLLNNNSYNCPTILLPQSLVSQAKSVPFRNGEMNTATSGGISGVSNAWESGLWILKSAFMYALNNISGINIQGNCITGVDFYSPFYFTINSGTPNTFTLTSVAPLYYGILAFQQLTSNSAKIYPTTVTSGTSTLVDVYDTGDISNISVEKMVVINRDTVTSGNVNVTPRGTYTSATVCDVTAPLFSSTSGITICGQNINSAGVLTGTFTTTTVTPSAGVYSIPMTTADAKLVTFNP